MTSKLSNSECGLSGVNFCNFRNTLMADRTQLFLVSAGPNAVVKGYPLLINVLAFLNCNISCREGASCCKEEEMKDYWVI